MPWRGRKTISAGCSHFILAALFVYTKAEPGEHPQSV
jgi:hypothetical protein